MSRRLIAVIAAAMLVVVACGDDDAAPAEGTIVVPDVIGETPDFARGTLAAVGLTAEVVEVADAGPDLGLVADQIPAAGTEVEAGSAVALFVPVADEAVDGEEATTTTAAGAESTTTTAAGSSTTAAPATTAATTTTSTTATTTTTVQVGLTQDQCEDHPYYEPRSDPNCSRAEYRLVVNNTTSPRVWQCMSVGDGVRYNPDQPQNLQCIQDRNAPNLYFQNNPPAPPYPDYNPTIGTVDTFIECSWKDAEYILDRVDNLTQGSPNLTAGFQWLVSNDNEVCITR